MSIQNWSIYRNISLDLRYQNNSAMKTKQLILSVLCLILIPASLWARKEIGYVEDKWSIEGNRSVSDSPTMSIDNNIIYIASDKELVNLCITIKDLSGKILYTETATVSSGIEYPVSVTDLPQGEYLISIVQGDRYIVGIFVK